MNCLSPCLPPAPMQHPPKELHSHLGHSLTTLSKNASGVASPGNFQLLPKGTPKVLNAYSFGTRFLQNSITAVVIFLEAVTRRALTCTSFSSLFMPCSLLRRCARSRCMKRSPLVAALDAKALNKAFPA